MIFWGSQQIRIQHFTKFLTPTKGRQRAWIAMTLAQETEIIMLDEPTTYLDMSYQLEVLEVLQRLNKEKKITVVIVLHELNNACRFAHNIIGLKKGKLICEGKPMDVINKENLKKIYGITIEMQKEYPDIYYSGIIFTNNLEMSVEMLLQSCNIRYKLIDKQLLID